MISPKDIDGIAALSRIRLDDQERDTLARDLEAILGYIKTLEHLDTAQVPPTSHVLPLQNVFRRDEIVPSLSQAEALSIAVEQCQGAFRVPQIIE